VIETHSSDHLKKKVEKSIENWRRYDFIQIQKVTHL